MIFNLPNAQAWPSRLRHAGLLFCCATVLLVACGDDTDSTAPQPDTTQANDIQGADSETSSKDDTLASSTDTLDNAETTDDADSADNADVNEGPQIVIEELQPQSGLTQGGETVAIVGSGFAPDSLVLFDGSPGTFVLFINEERLHVTTPPHSPGTVEVTVISPDGQYTKLADAFTYFNPVTVSAIEPNTGPAAGGTPITVTGSGFSAASNLIIGHTKALSTQVINDHTILALVPPGEAGWADVIVSNPEGVHRLKNGFQYTIPPTIDTLTPVAGPVSGGQSVTITGSGLEKPVSVWFGSTPCDTVTWITDKKLHVTTPSGTKGVVDVRVDSAQGTVILSHAYHYTDVVPSTLEILHLSPNHGSETGNELVAITTSVLGSTDDTVVRFGGVDATIKQLDPLTNTLTVITPQGSGVVDVEVETSGQTDVAKDAFSYIADMTVTDSSPSSGPTEGGTDLVIKGTHFGANAMVFVGALAATNVEVISNTEIHATTPPGTPGSVDIRVISSAKEAVLAQGFTYLADGPEVYVVVPGHGAIAGGTWVQVIGAGFTENAAIEFGGKTGLDITYVDSGLMTVRTPAGDVGDVDVVVTNQDTPITLHNGFTYYDPMTLFGGTWGDDVDVAINITVLDGMTAQPVSDAFVILDNDPTTPYQGLTNASGQITFSGPDLGGAHTIGVSKEAYVTYSVVHFDAENITVFLNPIVEGSADSAFVAPAAIEGKVTGLGKYLYGTPGECEFDEETDPIHCSTCTLGDECGGNGAKCTDLGSSQGWYCLKGCTEEADCPVAHACQAIEGSKQCVPLPGQKVAVCTGTKPYFRFYDVPLGPGAMAKEDGSFNILAFPTEVAVVCFGGFYLKKDTPTSEVLEKAIKKNPNNVFQPVVMGVVRHLLLEPGTVKQDVEVKLNIPLKRTIHVRMEKPPLDDTDYLWAHTYLDLGSDGVVQMPVVRFLYKDEPFLIDGMPSSMSGNINDATFTFYAGANSYSNSVGYNYPKAYVVRQNVVEPQDDRMLRLVNGTWETPSTGLTQSLQSSHTTADGMVYTVGTGGTIFKYDGTNYQVMPSPTKKTLRGIHGTGPDNLWAVGDDGKVLHNNGVGWTEATSPTKYDLRAVRVEKNGVVRVVGNYIVSRRDLDGSWTNKQSPLGSWFAIDGTDDSDIWIGGRNGKVRHFNGTKWSLVETPTTQGIRAIAAIAKNNVWFAGEAGLLMHYNGSDFTVTPPLSKLTLNALEYRSSTELVAVGDYGTVLVYDGTVWVPAPVGDYNQDLHAISLPKESGSIYTFGDHQLILGPIVAPARVSAPKAGQVLEKNEILWTADKRVEPHLQHVEIMIPGPFGPILIWELIADGLIGKAPLPDFAALKGTPGLQTGKHYLRITRVYQEGFDIDNFDYTDLGSFDRQSWAVEYFPFTVEADEPNP